MRRLDRVHRERCNGRQARILNDEPVPQPIVDDSEPTYPLRFTSRANIFRRRSNDRSPVRGPWAVIAGGSEGVGAGFADELSKIGINLVLIARKPGPLEETAAKARANGVEVRTLALDLLVPDALDQIKAVTDDVEVGLLIFNAGANSYGHEFVTGDLTGFAGVIELNINKQLELSHHFGGLMKDGGRAASCCSVRWPDSWAPSTRALRGLESFRSHLRRKPVARTLSRTAFTSSSSFSVSLAHPP